MMSSSPFTKIMSLN